MKSTEVKLEQAFIELLGNEDFPRLYYIPNLYIWTRTGNFFSKNKLLQR